MRNDQIRSAEGKLLSVIIPCYDEESVIAEVHHRLLDILAVNNSFNVELIYVNDGSRDRTESILNGIVAECPHAKAIHFSRNFGHQVAVSAGLEHASGDMVAIIDADLQDPPEILLEMVAEWENAADVAYGQRLEREGESHFKLLSAKYFYRILNYLSDTWIPTNTGDFRLMDR